MNAEIFIYYLVMFLETLIAVLPWLIGLCCLLIVLYIVMVIMEKRDDKQRRR